MSEQKPAEFGPAQPMGDGGAWGASGVPYAPDPQPLGAPSPTQLDTRSPARRNWWALASLGTAIVVTPAAILLPGVPPIVVPTTVVGVVLAQVALATSKKPGRVLRKTSILAMVLNVVMVVVWPFVPSLLAPQFHEVVVGEVSIGWLQVGDCVQAPAATDVTTGDLSSDLITRVLCEDEHWGQVYFTANLEPGTYPGNDRIGLMVDDLCYSEEAVNAILPDKIDEAWLVIVHPSERSWNNYDRHVTCFVTFLDERPFIGSWLVED